MEEADGRIVHLADDHAVVELFGTASIEEFLFEAVAGNGFAGSEEEIAHGGHGVAEKRGAAMAIGLVEIGAGAARHQKVLEHSLSDKIHFLRGDSLFINGISADERGAFKIFREGIVHQRNAEGKNARINLAAPVAMRTQTAHELIH